MVWARLVAPWSSVKQRMNSIVTLFAECKQMTPLWLFWHLNQSTKKILLLIDFTFDRSDPALDNNNNDDDDDDDDDDDNNKNSLL